MKSRIKSKLEQLLRAYTAKKVKITGRIYDLHVFTAGREQCLNEAFILEEVEEKELYQLLNTNFVPVTGNVIRIGFYLTENQLVIKDYRKKLLSEKSLHKISRSFISKLKKAIANPSEAHFRKLFDRNDIVEEFYFQYRNTRNFLLENLSGIEGEIKKKEFVDKLMMQMIALWHLQEKGFFNNDPCYFINKFKEIKTGKQPKYSNFCEFLVRMFDTLKNDSDDYYDPENVIITGPAVFLIDKASINTIHLPDECFYQQGTSTALLNHYPRKFPSDIPLLNLLETKDWNESNVNGFVFGAIYEKIIKEDQRKRKKMGSYYTPEEITTYICRNTIEEYLAYRINSKLGREFPSLASVLDDRTAETATILLDELKEIKILDPAVGSGHFLDEAMNIVLRIYQKVIALIKELNVAKSLDIAVTDKNGKLHRINVLNIENDEKTNLLLKYHILQHNIYGTDINPVAVKIAGVRLFLSLAKHYCPENASKMHLPSLRFNLKAGNALLGVDNFVGKLSEREKNEITKKDFFKPVQWSLEFPEVLNADKGFDVIIGNPPYVNPGDVDYWHLLKGSKNLYDAFIRLALDFLKHGGRLGFIHPNSAYCQPKFRELREFIRKNVDDLTVVNYAIRPQPVFKGVMQRTAITTCKKEVKGCRTVKTSRYLRLSETNRHELLSDPPVFDSSDVAWAHINFIPKIGCELDYSIFSKVFSQEKRIKDIIDNKNGTSLYYHDSGESYWTKLVMEKPHGIRKGKAVSASHWKKIKVKHNYSHFIATFINSTLFYWIWLTISDCRDLTLETLMQTPIPDIRSITGDTALHLASLSERLMNCYNDNSKYVEKRPGYVSLEYRVNRCKKLINKIDRTMGSIFGLDEREIDYLIKYDKEMRTV